MRESSSGNRPRSSSASRASRLRPSHRVSRMLVSSSPLVASTSSSTSKVALSRLTSTPVGATGTTTRSATEAAVLKTSRSLGGVSTMTTCLSPLFPSSSRACRASRSLSAATTSNGSSPADAHSSALRSVSASSTTTSPPPLATVAKYTADVLLPTPPLRFTTATINAPSPPLPRFTTTQPANSAKTVKLCSCEHVTLCSQTTVNTVTCEEALSVNTACCEQSKQGTQDTVCHKEGPMGEGDPRVVSAGLPGAVLHATGLPLPIATYLCCVTQVPALRRAAAKAPPPRRGARGPQGVGEPVDAAPSKASRASIWSAVRRREYTEPSYPLQPLLGASQTTLCASLNRAVGPVL